MSTKTKALGDAIYAVVTDITPSWATVLACGRASKIWDAYYDVDFSDESKGLEIVALWTVAGTVIVVVDMVMPRPAPQAVVQCADAGSVEGGVYCGPGYHCVPDVP